MQALELRGRMCDVAPMLRLIAQTHPGETLQDFLDELSRLDEEGKQRYFTLLNAESAQLK